MSSKELFFANGGDKLYIYKDGFGDVYNATPEEEAAWIKEIIADVLLRIKTEQDATGIKWLVNTLRFHKYAGVEELLRELLIAATPERACVLASLLWAHYRYPDSFRIIHDIYMQYGDTFATHVFSGLTTFRDNSDAKNFLLTCMESTDAGLRSRAETTMGMWAYINS